jgi:competence protein ComEC
MNVFSTTPLLPVAVSLIVGIVADRWWQPPFPLPVVLLTVVFLALACRRWAVAQSVAILVCFVVLGMTLVQMHRADDNKWLDEALAAVIMSEPAERPKTVGVDLLVPSAGGRTLRCYLWKDERSMRLRLGDELTVRLRDSDRQPKMFFVHRNDWQLGGSARSQLSRWQRLRLWFLERRHVLLERYRSFHAEEGSYAVLAAMTLGDRSAQTAEMREVYAVSGASHVLAISGLHLGIVYMLLTWFTLGRRRFWLSQVVIVAAIWAFALLTGLSASVTRAATMISVYAIFSSRGGRKASVNVLCFAAIAMLVANPDTLFDVGFQLSFASVFGILVLMPLVQTVLRPRNVFLRWTWNLMLVSCCAQIAVAPLIAFYFGRFSTYFLLTNFLVIPAATVIIYGALLSLIVPQASVALLWVVGILNRGLAFIASLPGASIEGLHPTVMQVVLVYVFFALCYLMARKLIAPSLVRCSYEFGSP